MPLVIAHRGASADAPENSVQAFALARQYGADGVELDVRLCGTGEVVVFHDSDLRRLGNRSEQISHLSWAQLKQTRLVSGATIPCLPEVFEACGPDMLINIEIKTEGLWRPGLHSLVAAVARVLQKLPQLDRVLLSSFNPLAVAMVAAAMPHVKRGLLFEAEGPLWARAQWLARCLPLHSLHPQSQLCSGDEVLRWKRKGYAIHVWTVDDPDRQRELADWGVDGIITNRPRQARDQLKTR